MHRAVGQVDSMHRIGGVTLVQPQSEAVVVLERRLRASDAGSEDGLNVGESTANVDRRRVRLEIDQRDNEQDQGTVTGEVSGAGRQVDWSKVKGGLIEGFQ
jgi:hypothetical protein